MVVSQSKCVIVFKKHYILLVQNVYIFRAVSVIYGKVAKSSHEWMEKKCTRLWFEPVVHLDDGSSTYRSWFFKIFSVQLCLKDTIVTAIFQYILLAPVLESLTCAGREKNSSGAVVTVYTPKKMNSLREQLKSIPWNDIVMYCEPTKPICIQKCKQRLTSLNSVFSMSDFTAFNN